MLNHRPMVHEDSIVGEGDSVSADTDLAAVLECHGAERIKRGDWLLTENVGEARGIVLPDPTANRECQNARIDGFRRMSPECPGTTSGREFVYDAEGVTLLQVRVICAPCRALEGAAADSVSGRRVTRALLGRRPATQPPAGRSPAGLASLPHPASSQSAAELLTRIDDVLDRNAAAS